MDDAKLSPDPVLAGLIAKPFRVERPVRQTSPFVFASPHSGRLYPPSFVAASRLTPLALRRSEDAFVDELFAGVVALGSPLIAAEFPRVYVDVNRAASELDGQMFDDGHSLDVEAPSPRVAAGLGVIPRVVRDGIEIYRDKLPGREAEERLALLYRPYHAALAMLVNETFARFGAAVVVDCHSMPSGPPAASVVFGDCYGASAAHSLLRHAESAFEANGFSTTRNAPYAGGYTTHLYARRDAGMHALQIEVSRALYLDEERIEASARFAEIRERLTAALARLVQFDAAALRPRRPLAAE
ncbi:MAG TPA: N-formylglutamate amidohydrolase [Rhizomicrobium sp.]|nr:N-formylglutamate amidohydrolase [Rhizomicrobium sp.]